LKFDIFFLSEETEDLMLSVANTMLSIMGVSL
jgi:hypothetical protein